MDESGHGLDDLLVELPGAASATMEPGPWSTDEEGSLTVQLGSHERWFWIRVAEGADGPQRDLTRSSSLRQRFGDHGQRVDAHFDGTWLQGELDRTLRHDGVLRVVVRSGPRIPLRLLDDPGGPLVATLHPLPSTDLDTPRIPGAELNGFVPELGVPDGYLGWQPQDRGLHLVRARALDWLRTPVHRTAQPFARFDRLPRSAEGQVAWRLRVESADGLHAGEVTLDHLLHFPRPVELRLAPLASLELVLQDERGAPVRDAELELTRLDGEGRPRSLPGADRLPALPAGQPNDAAGVRRWSGLPAGPFALEVRRQGSRRLRTTVDLRGGGTEHLHLALLPLGGTGELCGTLRAGCDPRGADVQVRLIPEELDDQDADGLERRVPVTWEAVDGQWSGHWCATDLPEGSYRVEPTTRALFDWSPLSALARPGDADLRFELCDQEPRHALHLLVLDDRTGRPVPQYRVEVRGQVGLRQLAFGREVRQDPGPGDTLESVDWTRPLLEGVPQDGRVDVRVVTASGEARATLEDFHERVITADGARGQLATVRVGR